jgi:hypothetical protein
MRALVVRASIQVCVDVGEDRDCQVSPDVRADGTGEYEQRGHMKSDGG